MKKQNKSVQLKRYSDYGVSHRTPNTDKVDFTKFKIIVASDEDKTEIMNAMKYIHDLGTVDTEFVTVNQLIHEYDHGDESNKYSNIVVDYDLYRQIEQKTCIHSVEDRIVQDGIHYCKKCWKALKFSTRHKD